MSRRSSSPKSDVETLKQDGSDSTLSSIELNIAESLANDRVFRNAYLRRWAANEVSAELRAMRLMRKMKQAVLAKKAHTGQSAISRIEKQNYDGWTFKTLLTIAQALDARLSIKLEPIEDVIRRFSASGADPIVETDAGGTTEFADVFDDNPMPPDAIWTPPIPSEGTSDRVEINP